MCSSFYICFFWSAVGDINIILFLFFSESMRQLWDPTKAVQKNLSDFGLAFDSNKVINAKSTKAAMVDRAKKSDGNPWKKIEEDKELKQVEKWVLNLVTGCISFGLAFLFLSTLRNYLK